MAVESTSHALTALEAVVLGSVGVTARALATVAPDLTLLQWRVIVVLAPATDGMAVSELAGHLGSRLPAMSRLLGRLRSRGLVQTGKDAQDGRVTIARLAPEARVIWERVRDGRRDHLRAALALAGVTEMDAAVLHRIAAGLAAFG
jgi:DNA-binding MarR family transcriptional regulator